MGNITRFQLRIKHQHIAYTREPGQLSRYKDGLWLDVRGSIPWREKRFFSTPQRPDRFVSNGYLGLFPRGVKRPRREADHSHPSNAKVRNGGAIPPLPHVFMTWCLINEAQGNLYFCRNLNKIRWVLFEIKNEVGNDLLGDNLISVKKA
jgi:hypothetical protein